MAKHWMNRKIVSTKCSNRSRILSRPAEISLLENRMLFAAAPILQIQAGGLAVGSFAADQYYSANSFTASTANPIDTTNVANAAPAGVYQSVRYGSAFSYTLPAPAGSILDVRLHFEDSYDTAAGQRYFNVAINNNPVLTNFDVIGDAGGVNRADVKDFTATADANGNVTVGFFGASGSPDQNALVCGIELYPVTTFAGVYPTAAEQYELTLVNRARANPGAEVARWTNNANDPWPGADLNEGITANPIDPSAKQPLAFNPTLIDSARKHSVWINTTGQGSLKLNEGFLTPDQRMVTSGYKFGPGFTWSEIIGKDPFGAPTTQGTIDGLEQLLFVDNSPYDVDTGSTDRIHRRALMNNGVNEVGIGIGVPRSGTIITEDFANSGNGSFLTGVLFNDTNLNGAYDMGEGAGGVTITAVNTVTNQSFATTSWDAGGYSMALQPGTYTVTASGGTIGAPTPQVVTIAAQNVEADFIATASAAPTAPTITAQPTDGTAFVGASATFSVAGTGSPFPIVQWQTSSDGGATFTNVASATGFTYSFTATADNLNSQYRAVLSNAQGSVTSSAAKLTVFGVPLTITQQPQSQTANAGDSVTFTVGATGATSYQWYTGGSLTISALVAVPGATSSTYTFNAPASPNPLYLRVVVSNPSGQSAPVARLIINTAPVTPTVVAQPQTAVATAGGTATLTVAVAGTPAPTVQWQVATPTPTATPAAQRNGSFSAFRVMSAAVMTTTFVDVAGLTETTVTLPVTMADNHSQYRAVITNADGSVTTVPIKLTVNKKSAATNDRTSLATAVAAAKAAIAGCRATTAAAAGKLNADLRRLKASAAIRRELAVFVTTEKVGRAKFTKDENAYLRSLTRLAALADAASVRLAAHPTNPALQAASQSAVAALSSMAASGTSLPVDSTQCSLGEVNALDGLSNVAPTDAQLSQDLYAAGVSSNGIGRLLQAPVTIAQAVATRLATDA